MLRSNVLEETCSRIIYFCNKHFLKDGICIHSPMLKLGLQDNLLLSNNLLSLYAKCYGVGHARRLFDKMPHRDVVSWTGVLSAYIKDGNHEEALRFFHAMNLSGEKPNEFTFSNVLRSCDASKNLVHGTKVHASLIKHGFESNPILCSSLIDLYSKRGCLEEAVSVFNGIANGGDTVSWTAMISSFVQAGHWVRALRFFIRMTKEKVSPNEYTFVKLLSACGFLGIDSGKSVHAQLIIWGVRLNLVLKTALVDMYAKCREMENAAKVFGRTSEQDVQLWTALISGFTQNLNFHEAIISFKQMVGNKIAPNNYSFAGILNACSSSQDLKLGKQLHAQIIMAGLENDVSVANALLDFYTKCSDAVNDDVGQVFEEITQPNVISWTTLIAGLTKHGRKEDCFLAFLELRFVGLQPNSYTLCNILQACGAPQTSTETRKIHGYIIKTDADNDITVGNALVDAYAGVGMVDCAMNLAKRIRNVITYTILASKLNKIGRHNLSLEIINHMRRDDLPIDGFIMSSFLSASANLGDAKIGKQLHCYSVVSGFGNYISVSNGLIEFYGKCRCIQDAQKVFGEISEPNVVSWNSLIHTSALSGHIASSLSTLEDMRLAGLRPDSHTLLAVLFACDKGGLVDMGVEYFQSLRELYDIKPQFYHYNLLVDLLGKAGRLEDAVSLAKSMPSDSEKNASVYKRLLSVCKLHGNVILGEEMAKRGLALDPSDLEFYVLLASVYDEAGRADLGDNMRSVMKEGGLRKDSRFLKTTPEI